MDTLPKDLSDAVDLLCRQGDQFAGMDQYDDALERYGQAWDLLPAPRDQWPAATWILMSAGDAHFRLQEFDEAIALFEDAFDYPDGAGNPFLMLRYGQCLLELGQVEPAVEALHKAFQAGGEALFEDEDPRYLTLIQTQARISAPAPRRFHHPLP